MARFHAHPSKPVTPRAPPIAAWRRSLAELPAQDAPELTKGPGWFDSSWELEHGLRVSEGLPGDAGLYEWLAVALRA